MLRYFFIVFLKVSLVAQAQAVLSGKVIDPMERSPLPFVNIGIKNKNLGTISGPDGSFSVTIPATFNNDSLTFSLVGYSELTIPIENMEKKLIPLLPKPKTFDEVLISTTALKEKKFGIYKRRNIGPHFIDGIIQNYDIFEIAQIIPFPDYNCKLNSVNLYISDGSHDTVIYRLNLYHFDGSIPSTRLTEKTILKKEKLKEGWLEIDISSLEIYAKGNVAASVEFLSPQAGSHVSYEVKLGGRSKSYYRRNSQGQWQRAPFHYQMFISALVPDKQFPESEEKESVPDLQLYSQEVRDSFSIFVHLPKNYNASAKAKYPVVYLLDGNAYFDLLSEFFEKQNTEAILVGVGYKNAWFMDSLRQRDYTFPESKHLSVSGGAASFRQFIIKELIPHIENKYRVNRNKRLLAGHSLGGYFVLYCMEMEQKEKIPHFSDYLAVSPSLDYADYYLLRNHLWYSEGSSDQTLYLAYGSEEKNELGNSLTSDIDGFLSTYHSNNHFKIIVRQFPDLDHMGTALPGFENAVKILLMN